MKASIIPLPPDEARNPIWFSVSEAAKFGGVQSKTIRRGLDAGSLTYKVIGNRYLINSATLIAWLLANTKLRNKFLQQGFGQYVAHWRHSAPDETKKNLA